ncbi:MAG: hypothetical protein JWR19_3720 [Pedosphaera sp.]|nr:hypothetical protein [Pedosphaera sp.]
MKKTIFAIGLVVVIGCTVAAVVITRRLAALEAVKAQYQTAVDRKPAPVAVAAEPLLPVETNFLPTSTPQPELAMTGEKAGNKTPNLAAQNVSPAGVNPAQAPAEDPLAREALSYVGADANAERYWVEAINDPSRSAHERQNLIEDLNEDGLSDPKHPSVADLPLIWSRILLIEKLAPDAMDTVNAKAFDEAYKDLLEMYARLTNS